MGSGVGVAIAVGSGETPRVGSGVKVAVGVGTSAVRVAATFASSVVSCDGLKVDAAGGLRK